MKKITLLFTIILSLDCIAQTTAIPDANFETYLETHKADGSAVTLGDADSMGNGVMDNLVLTANISGVETLLLVVTYISDLTGIEDFTALKYLDLSVNNSLTNLDLSKNTALTRLACSNNNLTSLDLSKNTALTRLSCGNNNLETLNIKNGNNTAMTELSVGGNPNLYCFQVDDKNNNTGVLSPINSLSWNDCTRTYIPDDAFEAGVIERIESNGPAKNPSPTIDDYIITEAIIDYLNLGSGGINLDLLDIKDLTGIEDFTNLKTLVVTRNPLVNLDLRSNTALTYLDCSQNYTDTGDPTSGLNTLNVSGLTELTTLIGSDNIHLSSIDLTGATALTNLNLGNNRALTDLDLSSNVALTTVDVSRTKNLTNLDLGSNVALTTVDVSETNNLTNLDLSNNILLTDLNCYGSIALTSLNIQNGNNTNLIAFETRDSANLTCIQVDDVAYMNENWSTNQGLVASYSLNCSILGIADNRVLDFGLYPNPVKNTFTIKLDNSAVLQQVIIYTMLGQAILTSNEPIVNTSYLVSGYYLVEVITNLGKTTKKIVIE